jgi:hypothetical protein
MVDYAGALKQGLSAAEVADRARKEIDAVFVELDSQIRKATEGKISMERQEFETEQGLFVALRWPPKPRETYWAIVAHNPRVGKSYAKELARWTQARGGYPCKIVLGNAELICEDREALENSLALLLRDSLVGENLQALMQMEPMPEGGTVQQTNQSDGE